MNHNNDIWTEYMYVCAVYALVVNPEPFFQVLTHFYIQNRSMIFIWDLCPLQLSQDRPQGSCVITMHMKFYKCTNITVRIAAKGWLLYTCSKWANAQEFDWMRIINIAVVIVILIYNPNDCVSGLRGTETKGKTKSIFLFLGTNDNESGKQVWRVLHICQAICLDHFNAFE